MGGLRIPILSDITDGVKKIASTGFLNSTVAGCTLVMRGNGEVKESEKLAMKKHIVEHDILKAEGGNKAAGTRVRKQMQKVKQAAQVVRNRVLEIRSAQ